MKDIKIFVSHRIDLDADCLEQDMYIPVRCGAVFDNKSSTIQGDDTGDNISEKRMSFCELTVQYWAWKNVDAEYYGLCHYRRYLAFSDEKFEKCSSEHDNNCIPVNYVSDLNRQIYGINRANIEKYLDKYDVVACEPIDISQSGLTNYTSMKGAFDYHNIDDMDKAINIINDKYPEMKDIVTKYMSSNQNRLYNCYVMEADIFKKYSSWLFDILFELEKNIDMSKYGMKKYRTPGTIGERLFGIYMLYLKEKKSCAIKDLPLTFIRYPEKQHELHPAFAENNITIVSNFNDNYVKIFSNALLSAVEHFDINKNYDIILLVRDISNESKEVLKNIISPYKNISLRFFNPARYLDGTDKIIKHKEVYTEDLYYRIVVPYILNNFDKALVIDADIIVNHDLAELYETDIDGYMAAAVKDTVMQGYLNGMVPDQEEYIRTVLNISSPYDYFNSGICLMNLKNIRSTYSLEYIKNFVKKYIPIVRIYEQDMLNVLFYGHVKFLDQTWNFFTMSNDWVTKCINLSPLASFLKYQETRKAPYIIHYAAAPKPWQNPSVDMGKHWWITARKSPYYEEILSSLFNEKVNEVYNHINFGNRKKLNAIQKFSLKLKYFRCSVLSKITSGRKKIHYKNKKKEIRRLMKEDVSL